MQEHSEADVEDLSQLDLTVDGPAPTLRSRVVRVGIGALAGGLLGLGLYGLVGCNTGCVLVSSPWLTSVYGALVGGIAAFR